MCEKMRMASVDITEKNIEKIGELFPNCITETKDKDGNLRKAINFDTLKQMLSKDLVEGDEAYEFTWVGKKAAMLEANKPIRKTLRPCPEESVNWDTTENLYIEGDNLEALKLLQESYLGKVKMIYIDPPYNTGNDFIYADDFMRSQVEENEEMGMYDEEGNRLFKNTDTNAKFHSDWCSMMFSRLLLSRNLLKEDGIVFISINDKELNTLKNICLEVFGAKNFIATLIWDKNVSAQSGIYKVYHEYVLVFSKNIDNIKVPHSLTHEEFEASAVKKISGRHPGSKFIFPKGTRFDAPDGTILQGNIGDIIKINIVDGKMIAKDHKLLEDVTIEAGFTQLNQMKQYFYGDKENLVDSNNQKITEFFFNKTGKIQVKKIRSVETPQTTCNFGTQAAATNELMNLFELQESPFSSPKPTAMLVDFILRFTEKEDLILDFFSGSATTAHAVFLANIKSLAVRKFILIQIQENLDKAYKLAQKDAVNTLKVAIDFLNKTCKPHAITEIGKERIRRAGNKIKDDLQSEIEQLSNSISLNIEEIEIEKENKKEKADSEKIQKLKDSILELENKKVNKQSILDGLDIGFRVFKVDDSNMEDVYYSAGEYSQGLLSKLKSNIKEDRTDLDLLFGCLLEWGLPLSMPYKSEKIDNFNIHTYNDGDLIACFDENISENVIKEIANRKPIRAVFRDSSFTDSPAKINVTEIFKLLSPNTQIKVI